MKQITFLRRSLTRLARCQKEFASLRTDRRPMLGCDWTGRVVLCNQAAEHLLGRAASDVLDKLLDVFLRVNVLDQSYPGGLLTTKEGTPVEVKVYVGPLKDRQNHLVGRMYVIWPNSTGGNGTEQMSE